MRFVDYSYELAQTALDRLTAGEPINARHYNAILAWLALAHDVLLDPAGHILRSPNAGSVAQVMFRVVRAPFPEGQQAMAVGGGLETPGAGSPAWAMTVDHALAWLARDMESGRRVLGSAVDDSIPGQPGRTHSYALAALAGPYGLAAIDSTALDPHRQVQVSPGSRATITAVRAALEQMLEAITQGDNVRVTRVLASSQELTWAAQERRASAMRAEAMVSGALVVMLLLLFALRRSARAGGRTAAQRGGAAGPIRLPGPGPIGRAGMGPTRLA